MVIGVRGGRCSADSGLRWEYFARRDLTCVRRIWAAATAASNKDADEDGDAAILWDLLNDGLEPISFPTSSALVRRWALQIARALVYMHARNVVHCGVVVYYLVTRGEKPVDGAGLGGVGWSGGVPDTHGLEMREVMEKCWMGGVCERGRVVGGPVYLSWIVDYRGLKRG